jgi:Zn-finger nucleic acid-binding protein
MNDALKALDDAIEKARNTAHAANTAFYGLASGYHQGLIDARNIVAHALAADAVEIQPITDDHGNTADGVWIQDGNIDRLFIDAQRVSALNAENQRLRRQSRAWKQAAKRYRNGRSRTATLYTGRRDQAQDWAIKDVFYCPRCGSAWTLGAPEKHAHDCPIIIARRKMAGGEQS